MGESPFKGAKLAQVAFVVNDLSSAVRRWATLLGVPEPTVIETAPGEEIKLNYRGTESNARAKLAFFDLGGVQLELIEPIGLDSAWYEGLADRGEGFHHIAFWTEDMAGDRRFLESHRVAMNMRGDMGEGQFAYFDAADLTGGMIELLERRRTEVGPPFTQS
jgi:catechol 2,3-dioxygenase-like lactoylglutathione lyase family enzyme